MNLTGPEYPVILALSPLGKGGFFIAHFDLFAVRSAKLCAMTMPLSASLKHVSFLSANADAVIAFYGLLGAAVQKDLRTAEGFRRVVLAFEGGGKLQFLEVAGEQPSPYPGWQEHIALHLSDLNTGIRALQEQGVTFSRELTLSPSGNQMAFVIDPDGRQVELLQA